VAATVALVALGAAVLPLRSSGSHSPSSTVVLLPPPGGVPLSYHIVYRVKTGTVVSTEELWVHRPFEAEDVVFGGSEAQGQPLSTIVDRLGRQMVRTGGAPGVFQPPPTPTHFDVRLDAVAGSAAGARALTVDGHLVVAGRRCRVFRSAQSLLSTTLAGRPTRADHVDTCVDAQGLLLNERRVVKGKLVQERTATAVDVGGEAVNHSYRTSGTHIPLKQGGGAVVTISDTSRPPGVQFWEPAPPPPGFSHLGRFAVVAPQPPTSSVRTSATLVTAVDDVFVRGADALIIEQGQTGAAPFQPPSGTDIDLGRLGRGRLVLSATASSVTALPNRSSFVRVSGTVPPQELTVVARSLEPQPPGTLVTVPDLTSDGA